MRRFWLHAILLVLSATHTAWGYRDLLQSMSAMALSTPDTVMTATTPTGATFHAASPAASFSISTEPAVPPARHPTNASRATAPSRSTRRHHTTVAPPPLSVLPSTPPLSPVALATTPPSPILPSAQTLSPTPVLTPPQQMSSASPALTSTPTVPPSPIVASAAAPQTSPITAATASPPLTTFVAASPVFQPPAPVLVALPPQTLLLSPQPPVVAASPPPPPPTPANPLLTAATTAWQYGVCPLVVSDADFVGNDVANAPEPDVATCCNECRKSLLAWKEAHPATDAQPTLKDNVCLAWTFTADKMCYLKNGIQNSTFLTIHKVPGSFTGSFAGNLTSLQANYDQLVQEYFIPTAIRSAASAVANATADQTAIVSNSCTEPHCQQMVAVVNATAIVPVAPGYM